MLILKLETQTLFDDEESTFHDLPGGTYKFEHSLYSVARWEEKYKKPFLDAETKTGGELLDYYKFMCFDGNFNPALLTSDAMFEINTYIGESFTATKLSPQTSSPNHGSFLTSEVLYAAMANTHIPFSCDRWNLTRLLAVIGIISEQNAPKKKRSFAEVQQDYRKLNAERKAKLKSKG
jgi:hypothetical protein